MTIYPASIEPLEARIAPAAVVTYTDFDGDIVKITASKGPLDLADLTLSGGTNGQLQLLDLTAPGFSGADITFTVTRGPQGQGNSFAHVGRINATGVDLGNVTVIGDLGVIDAGDNVKTTAGLGTLRALSMGVLGTTTQAGASPDLVSNIAGRLGALNITADITGAIIQVVDPTLQGDPSGSIGSIFIGGTFLGGSISADGNVGNVKVGGTLSGDIFSGGRMGAVDIRGSLIQDNPSGSLYSVGDMSAVKVAGDLRIVSEFTLIGAGGKLASLSIGGSILSEQGNFSDTAMVSAGSIGAVVVDGDIRSLSGVNFTALRAGADDLGSDAPPPGDLASVTVGGSIRGGGIVCGGDLGFVKIAGSMIHGFLDENRANRFDEGRKVGSIEIGGDLIGDTNVLASILFDSIGKIRIGGMLIDGAIEAHTALHSVTIGGDVAGNSTISGERLDALSIGGSMRGGYVASGKYLGTVRIAHDMQDAAIGAGSYASFAEGVTFASLSIGGSVVRSEISSNGTLRAMDVGGSFIDSIIPAGSSSSSGTIDIGALKIRGSFIRSYFGAGGNVSLVSIGGDAVGGTGDAAATISAVGKIGTIHLGGSLLGATISSDRIDAIKVDGGIGSGGIAVVKKLGTLTVAGSFTGGTVRAAEIDLAKIGGNLEGGGIAVSGKLARVVVGGSVLGGPADDSAQITATTLDAVSIQGSLVGGSGARSGKVESFGRMGAISISGAVIGDEGVGSGVIGAGSAGVIRIGHNLQGGDGLGSGSISTSSPLERVIVGGSVVGGTGLDSGTIRASFAQGGKARIEIARDIRGGEGFGSGRVSAGGRVEAFILGGSLVGGSGNSTGVIEAASIGALKVGGDLAGGDLDINRPSLLWSGAIRTFGRIESLSIGGSIIAGVDDSQSGDLIRNAAIENYGGIGSLTVRGSILGNTSIGGTTDVFIGAHSQEARTADRNLVFDRITVGGRVQNTVIHAGYDPAGGAPDGDAQIGTVQVGGDWVASSLIAGARDTAADGFGNGDDAPGVISGSSSIARIASIVIGGAVFGTAEAEDHFGFVSHHIGSFKSAGYPAPLTLVSGAPFELALSTGDVTIREI